MPEPPLESRPSHFAYAYNTTANLSSFVTKQSDDLWQALQVTDPEHCTPVARLRRALDQCKALTSRADASSAAASTVASAPRHCHQRLGRARTAYRLDDKAVQKLVSTFQGEYLPSLRLLSLAHQWTKQHCKACRQVNPMAVPYVCTAIPGLMEARAARTLRTEAQLISSALFDETPALQVGGQRLPQPSISMAQQDSKSLPQCNRHVRVCSPSHCQGI